MYIVLKKRLHARKISATWIPHLLSDDQKRTLVAYTKKILKFSQNFDKYKFANVVTGVETWVQFNESQGMFERKFGQLKVPRDHVLPEGQ